MAKEIKPETRNASLALAQRELDSARKQVVFWSAAIEDLQSDVAEPGPEARPTKKKGKKA